MVALLLSLGVNLGLVIGSLSKGRQQPVPAEETGETGKAGETGEEVPHDDRRPRREPPPMLQRMADDLGLEGELRQRFLGQQMRFLGSTLEGRRRLGELQNALRLEVTSEAPNRQRIDRLLQESARVHYHLEKTFVENLLAGREMLDDEQEKHYFEMLVRWRRGRETRRILDRWHGTEDRRPLRIGPGLE